MKLISRTIIRHRTYTFEEIKKALDISSAEIIDQFSDRNLSGWTVITKEEVEVKER